MIEAYVFHLDRGGSVTLGKDLPGDETKDVFVYDMLYNENVALEDHIFTFSDGTVAQLISDGTITILRQGSFYVTVHKKVKKYRNFDVLYLGIGVKWVSVGKRVDKNEFAL